MSGGWLIDSDCTPFTVGERRPSTMCQTWGQPLSSHLILSYMGTLRWNSRHYSSRLSSLGQPRRTLIARRRRKFKEKSTLIFTADFSRYLTIFRKVNLIAVGLFFFKLKVISLILGWSPWPLPCLLMSFVTFILIYKRVWACGNNASFYINYF